MPFKHRFQSYQRKSLKEWVQELKESGLENIFENAFEYQYRTNGTFVVRPVNKLLLKGHEGSQKSPESESCVESSQKSQESDDLNKLLQEAQKDIKSLETQILQKDTQLQAKNDELDSMSMQLAAKNTQITSLSTEATAFTMQLISADEDRAELQRMIVSLQI